MSHWSHFFEHLLSLRFLLLTKFEIPLVCRSCFALNPFIEGERVVWAGLLFDDLET